MKVSWNRCTPQSSILMAFSLINHRFLGTPIRTLPMKQPFWLPAPNLGHVQLTSQALGHGALPEQSLLGQLERSPVRPVILGLWYILPWNRPSFGEKMEVSSENYVQWRSLIFFYWDIPWNQPSILEEWETFGGKWTVNGGIYGGFMMVNDD